MLARRELIGFWLALLGFWLVLELRLHAEAPAVALLALLVAGVLRMAASGLRRTTST